MDLGMARTVEVPSPVLDETQVWQVLRALAARASAGHPLTQPCGLRLDAAGELEEVALGHGWFDVHPEAMPPFRTLAPLGHAIEQLLELCLPLCVGRGSASSVVAHLAQSLDGQIATSSGASCFITGPQDLTHTHRLRALHDAVVVGRSTITHDDPQLTTRLVPGRNPTRVIVDPLLRAPAERRVFHDGAAPTLVLCAQGRGGGATRRGQAEVVEVASTGAALSPAAILEELARRSLRRVFIEGGGVTVSHFLRARRLGRIHVAVCSVLLGKGRAGLALDEIDGLDGALRPQVRRFMLGDDVLFDCAF